DHHAALAALRAHCAISLWVDNGTADHGAARRFLATGVGRLVIGSESQRDLGLVREFASDTRVALSLDFRDDQFVGPPVLLADPGLWPPRVIVMSLARIGGAAAAGPQRPQAHPPAARPRPLPLPA